MSMNSFGGRDFDWWFDLKQVLDMNDIHDAKELERRLDQNQRPAPPVTVTIPPGIRSNFAPPMPRPYERYLKPTKPTIGRIIHYIDRDGLERPAIITGISGFISLTSGQPAWVYLKAFVWGESGKDISDFAMQNEENKKAVRTWHWPGRPEGED